MDSLAQLALENSNPTSLYPPVISEIADLTIAQGTIVHPIQFTVADQDTPPEGLTFTVVSDNPMLLPNSPETLIVEGSGSEYVLRAIPNPIYSGLATIILSVRDGVYVVQEQFTLTVEPQPRIWIQSMTAAEPEQLHFEFTDTGTGATNYSLQFRPELSSEQAWSNLTGNVTTWIGEGHFATGAAKSFTPSGFYRIFGIRSLVTNVNFSANALQVGEGAGTVYLTIMLSQPYLGTLHYTVAGPDTASIEPLSGSLMVHGTTASIAIRLLDDEEVGTLKYLTLMLQPGPGYAVGQSSIHQLTIKENDAEWLGTLQLTNNLISSQLTQIVYLTNSVRKTNATMIPLTTQGTIDLKLRIQQSGDTIQGALVGTGFGFFPEGEWPANLVFTGNDFAAEVVGIQLPADTTLLGAPAQLQLRLTASNSDGQTNVSFTELHGEATLTIHYDGLPHLDTTRYGLFVLLRPPTKPSTKEPELILEP